MARNSARIDGQQSGNERAWRRRARAHLMGALLPALWALSPLDAALAQAAPDGGAAAPAGAAPDTAPAAAVPATAAGEPEAEAGAKLQEIVITATRHSALLSKVPISVSAFSQESLDNIGAKDISDVVRFTPGITIDADGSNSISIRGISSNAGSSTTAIYIDDTPIQMRTNGFNSDDALPKAFDLERIEVLRGPQGTLFGAGAEGGAVRYIMHQPNLHTSDMYVRAEASTTKNGAPSYETGIAAGAPLVDGVLGFRASAWYRRDGGWIDRLDPFSSAVVSHNSNYTDTYALRVAAKWAVSETVSVTPSMMYQDRYQHGITLYYPYLSDPGSTTFRNAEPDLRAVPDRYFLPALKVEAELGSMALISNTSFFTRREVSGYSGTNYNLGFFQTFKNPTNPSGFQYPMNPPPASCTNTSVSPLVDGQYPLIDGTGLHLCPGIQNYRANAPITNQQQSFTQEIRLQSDDPNAALVWTAGLFFSKTTQTSLEEIQDPMLNSLLNFVYGTDALTIFGVDLLPNGDSYLARNSSHDRQIAAFGEATYAITPKIKVTGGLRVSRLSLTFDHFGDGPQNFGPQGGSGSESETPVTPKLSLSFEPNRSNLFYVTYAKGFREGGANAPIPAHACDADLAGLGLTDVPEAYKSDSVNSYEIGSKNKIGDSLRIAASIYYINWQGIQQNVYMQGCGFQFVDNFGSAAAKGADLQIEYAPTESLKFDLAVGRTEAHYTSDAGVAPTLVAAKGDAVEGQAYGPAPPWTVALGAQYDFTAVDHKAFVRLDYEYIGHSGVKTATQDPNTGSFVQGTFTPAAYSFVSARAGMNFGQWNVSAFVDNLFNTHPQILDSSDAFSVQDTFNPAGSPSQLVTSYTLRPRTIGLTAVYHL